LTPLLRAYLLENVSILLPGGLQTVVFLWLVTVLLHESPERVGIAQMVSMLPGLLIIIPAGVVGDRFDRRRILILTHILMALPTLGMAILVWYDALTFGNLLVLALLGGIAGTFSGPPRDALLSHVAGQDIQRAVMLVLGLQFAAQIVGFGFASLTDLVGAGALLAAAAAMYALGAWPSRHLPGGRPAAVQERHVLRELREGFAFALRSERIWPSLALTFALGVFFAGSFMVLLPLVIRDVYQGGAADISLAFGCNMLGTVVTIIVLFRRGGVRRQGRALMAALLFGCVALALLPLELPYWAFFLLSFVWGLGGGFSLTMGRAIVQESAPPALAARLLSIYALGMTAGMPIGSLVIGYAVRAFGPLDAVWVPILGMAITVTAVHLTSRFWALQPVSVQTVFTPDATSDSPMADRPV
jgi:MFS family permease